MRSVRPSKRLETGASSLNAKVALTGSLTDREKISETSQANARQKTLELLYDYTKFHIGAYLTITGAYLTAAFADIDKRPVLPLNLYLMGAAIVFTMLAGFAGGVIVSSLTQAEAKSSADFLESRIGPWDWRAVWFKGRVWTYVEHTAFWLGLLAAALSFLPADWWSVLGITFLGGGYRHA